MQRVIDAINLWIKRADRHKPIFEAAWTPLRDQWEYHLFDVSDDNFRFNRGREVGDRPKLVEQILAFALTVDDDEVRNALASYNNDHKPLHATYPLQPEYTLCGDAFDIDAVAPEVEPPVFAKPGEIVTCEKCRKVIDEIRLFRGYKVPRGLS